MMIVIIVVNDDVGYSDGRTEKIGLKIIEVHFCFFFFFSHLRVSFSFTLKNYDLINEVFLIVDVVTATILKNSRKIN